MADVRTSDVLNWTLGKFTNDGMENATAVGWKDEDEVDGEPIGPVWIESTSGRENAETWVTLRFARALAAELGVPCEEW